MATDNQGESTRMSADQLAVIRREAVKIVLGLAPERVQTPTAATRLVEDLGYDSLRLFEMAIVLEQYFGVHARSDQPLQAQTIGDVERLVVQLADFPSQLDSDFLR
jgi:acyl carrier protein